MSKKKKYIPLTVLIIFSIYCSITVGQALDEQHQLMHGKNTFDYLVSLGQVNNYFPYREYYSTIYWSFLYFITEIFPSKYEIQITHLVNLFFSLGVVFGIGKVSKELFNKKVGKIVFLIFFLFPVFFGHMSINGKDTILAFSHVWIVYLILRYLKKQDYRNKINKYILRVGLLAALASGIQLAFLGSLITVFLYMLVEVFYFKNFINKSFSKKLFLFDLIKCFIAFYLILVLFWVDSHQNIFIYPFYIIKDWMESDLITGWPYTLTNGNYYLSVEVPSTYFLINFIYKTPEYVLILYLLFFILIFKSKDFYTERFSFINYKLFFVLALLIFPNLLILFLPFPVYDGLRLFLWALPYFSIIPGLSFYYLIENFKFAKSKVALIFLTPFFIYFLFNFLTITPYQYTYLNFFNGKKENRYQKFENDYWAISLHELIKDVNFNTDKVVKLGTCGIISAAPKPYLKKKSKLSYEFVQVDKADYIIMTNRVSRRHGVKNCFDIFKGENIVSVKRNGLILSVIRKI